MSARVIRHEDFSFILPVMAVIDNSDGGLIDVIKI